MASNPTLSRILAGLARENGRGHKVIYPGDVVAAARAPDHPLHDRFEWDDTRAGHHWRLHQARVLIASVQIEQRDDAGRVTTVQAYHHIRDEGVGYIPTEVIVRHESLMETLTREMLRDIRAMARRLRALRGAAPGIRAVRDGVAQTLRALRSKDAPSEAAKVATG